MLILIAIIVTIAAGYAMPADTLFTVSSLR